jgi:hypothetical protein
MKKIPDLLKDWFSPKELQGLDINEILGAFADPVVRNIWIFGIFEELKRLNLELDRRLLNADGIYIDDLAARRKAYQDMLDSVLSAKRRAKNNNPSGPSSFDLDSVTVLPG